jgi:hypothetical protein
LWVGVRVASGFQATALGQYLKEAQQANAKAVKGWESQRQQPSLAGQIGGEGSVFSSALLAGVEAERCKERLTYRVCLVTGAGMMSALLYLYYDPVTDTPVLAKCYSVSGEKVSFPE